LLLQDTDSTRKVSNTPALSMKLATAMVVHAVHAVHVDDSK